jgi:hypothetical protein
MSCPPEWSIGGFGGRTGGIRVPRQVGHGLRRVIGVEDHPEPVLVVGWLARRLGGDDRLDIGGLEDLLESQRHAGGYGADGRSPPPCIEPPRGRLV